MLVDRGNGRELEFPSDPLEGRGISLFVHELLNEIEDLFLPFG